MNALSGYTTVSLAYVDPAGSPQACAVFFALHGDSLVFVSSLSTLHGRSLASDGRVAFTAQAEGQHWSTLTGVQGRGTCSVVTGVERDVALAAYFDRFPFVASDSRLRAALERTEVWELRPSWLRVIDNSQGFGHKSEWTPEVS
jgi:uncharacterized protein YhbP (UPF0306 family)